MFKNLLTTLALVFVANIAVAQITTVGIIGSATPNEWASDSTMVQDSSNPDVWTTTMSLTTGEAKFRANNDWVINWGSFDFPNGTGLQGGDNIQVEGGMFDISFNTATGEYSFTSLDTTYNFVGMVGSATANGNFDDDIAMTKDSLAPWVWKTEAELGDGEVKFRVDSAWAINWGGDSFPVGVGSVGGANIKVVPGNYRIKLNSITAEYFFESIIPLYDSVAVIGTATVNGNFDDDIEMEVNPNNPQLWSLNGTFQDGELKFRANDDWNISWGDTTFPSGVGILGGPNIPVVAGEYQVNFNSTTGEYSFDEPIKIYNTIGILGTAVPNGFDGPDYNMIQDPIEKDQWKIQMKLTDGLLKFRAEDDWDVNWGGGSFPAGQATQDGDNIEVFSGTYEIKLNATTGVYSFTAVSVAIVGTATPKSSWDDDVDMAHVDSTNNFWYLRATISEAEMKFRQDDDWVINWGDSAFPAGTGTQDGDNIQTTAGTYDITINTQTGDYMFASATSTSNLLTPSAVKVFPNPTANTLNIHVEATELQGAVNIRIIDMTGKVLSTAKYDDSSNIQLNVANYPTGTYLLQVSNDKFFAGKRFVVGK